MAREYWRMDYYIIRLSVDIFSLEIQHHSHFQTRLRLCSVGCMSDFRHLSPAKIELGMPIPYPDVESFAQCGKVRTRDTLSNYVPLSKTQHL